LGKCYGIREKGQQRTISDQEIGKQKKMKPQWTCREFSEEDRSERGGSKDP